MSSEFHSESTSNLKPRIADDAPPDVSEVLKEVPYKIVTDILGHPQGSVSVPEISYMNPSVSESSIRYHLGELEDDGIIEKCSFEPGERTAGRPYTFYRLSEYGEEIVEAAGLDSLEAVFSDLYHVVVKTERILDIEEMERPA